MMFRYDKFYESTVDAGKPKGSLGYRCCKPALTGPCFSMSGFKNDVGLDGFIGADMDDTDQVDRKVY